MGGSNLSNLWHSLSLPARSLILGPTVIHLAILILGFFLHILIRVPFPTNALRRQPLWHRPLLAARFLWDCFYLGLLVLYLSFPAVEWFTFVECTSNQDIRDLLVRDTFLSWGWWDAARLGFLILVDTYRDMRSLKIESGRKLVRALLVTGRTAVDSCLKAWHVLDGTPTVLIVAPVVVYYGYFHILFASFRG
ncbi:hypothetical protein DFH09DRAFT_1420165 [Mycena vulgaris]|nr:hypothetical protein DFH09DRAFT_1420165 [Mycena vulgaris]